MIKANKSKVEITGDMETVSAEMIAIIREYVARVDTDLDGDPDAEALKAIRIYEGWKSSAAN